MSFQVTIEPSKHQFQAEAGQTVLDAALAAGIVLPYSCRTGACSTCKGKVVAGEVDAGPYPAQILSPEDLAQGYTLFCQAKPQSDWWSSPPKCGWPATSRSASCLRGCRR